MINALAKTAAALSIATAGTAALGGAGDQKIDLTYVWTAHPGQEERLINTYAAVGGVLEANEPGLLVYEIAVSESGHQLVIREVFEDADAMAFRLSQTAAQFFPELVTFATPGPFIFSGDVPAHLKEAAYGMEMGAIFTGDWSGFTRD